MLTEVRRRARRERRRTDHARRPRGDARWSNSIPGCFAAKTPIIACCSRRATQPRPAGWTPSTRRSANSRCGKPRRRSSCSSPSCCSCSLTTLIGAIGRGLSRGVLRRPDDQRPHHAHRAPSRVRRRAAEHRRARRPRLGTDRHRPERVPVRHAAAVQGAAVSAADHDGAGRRHGDRVAVRAVRSRADRRRKVRATCSSPSPPRRWCRSSGTGISTASDGEPGLTRTDRRATRTSGIRRSRAPRRPVRGPLRSDTAARRSRSTRESSCCAPGARGRITPSFHASSSAHSYGSITHLPGCVSVSNPRQRIAHDVVIEVRLMRLAGRVAQRKVEIRRARRIRRRRNRQRTRHRQRRNAPPLRFPARSVQRTDGRRVRRAPAGRRRLRRERPGWRVPAPAVRARGATNRCRP